ncbi:hypothetical protein VOLCADRAFT_62183 [Volvox carteri f. nagariensis]|uniref:Selenoprotein O n=1 Tax=Volvox carteri f. nagariensis TaxID=3068 RepID=D8U0T9_VOLCA|nr:uncharacterized protein VOLCADRAFT_62183 [Volvox carteri f. nagariensis]EFJ46698.1 hypothetical protein VOLCADRAFT_62183 [Volvox carteri f. nagariensis]|eukprot:XP_002952227.1 hypothetical protein VOLCADRAFT_62183 [Volvox carteri f. nagariensis]
MRNSKPRIPHLHFPPFPSSAFPPSPPPLSPSLRSSPLTSITSTSYKNLPWDHTFVKELPADPDSRNVVRQVEGALFSFVSPTPPSGVPYTVTYSRQVARLVGLDPTDCERAEFPLVMSGAAPLPGSLPYAAVYGGHQFGQWAGQLGDGRAITLGEVVNPVDGQRWELQLKGAGKTPYSRRADGRAVLRSSLREFVCSEAMAALGVPTTRALSLVGTGGPGAVVCRVAPSFMRFGTFQLPVSRGLGEVGLVKMAADWVIKYHNPHLASDLSVCLPYLTICPPLPPPPPPPPPPSDSPQPYLDLLREVTCRTATLVAAWQSLGFVHGVLNTDNMSILGLTIDYGPFGFLDKFDPDWTPNLTDAGGRRYSYRNQPEAVQFNLVMLGNALLAADLVPREGAEEVLREYSKVLSESYNARMAAKLGLREYDMTLTHELMRLMYDDDADFTNTFRALCSISCTEDEPPECASSDSGSESGSGLRPTGHHHDLPAALAAALNGGQPLSEERVAAWRQWLQAYRARLRAEGVPEAERQSAQRSVNPKFIPRQHLLQWAIEAAEGGDYSELETLLEVLERPYDDQPDTAAKYSGLPPEEMVRRPGVCMLSCSS